MHYAQRISIEPIVITLSPGKVRSIVMSKSVCLSVCLSTHITQKNCTGKLQSSPHGLAICYVLLFLQMILYFITMEP